MSMNIYNYTLILKSKYVILLLDKCKMFHNLAVYLKDQNIDMENINTSE
jgi:hypothetical protein